ncbi:MAG: hypothetical protein EZS28_020959 [Streblomastix strix]|uniref:Uncharacterized protein n=1 Tax=Streblomastix strix TaxID=222440 RepID=A0A5J4VM49_9EUKA|nr:MAG: hypothetical protein EZS28_020959 [Streblomastix strix]
MTLSQTDTDTINIVRCGMNETEMCVGLRLSNVMIQGGEGDFVIIWRLNHLTYSVIVGYSVVQNIFIEDVYLRSGRIIGYLRRYWTPPILLPITIPDAVIEAYNKIWTFEFGLQELNLGIGGNETELIENKTFMIYDNTNGYDQIFKDVSTTLDDKNKGWIQLQNGMNVSLQGIILTADKSIFIPAIYISDQNTTVKLEEFIIYDITFQPQIPYSSGPRGVIQIDLSFKDIQIVNCQFEKLTIESLGGSALRIQNFTDTPLINPPLILPLPHSEPDTSINISINSTSFIYIQSSGDINNRGGIYVILNKTFRFETKGTVIFTGCRTAKDTLEVVGGRDRALYFYLAEKSTFNFIIGQDTSFTTNEADICGEDIFIFSRNINILKIRTRNLFDITTFINIDNTIFGTEFKLIDKLYHIPLADYNTIERCIYYSKDTMHVLSRIWGGIDTEDCGDVNSTCNSFEHAVLKQTKPDITPTNLQSGQQIAYPQHIKIDQQSSQKETKTRLAESCKLISLTEQQKL